MEKHDSNIVRSNRDTFGGVIVFFTLIVAAFCGFVAFSLDIGNSLANQRRIQFASDAGAMAAARRMAVGGVTESDVMDDIEALANANGVTLAEINAFGGVNFGNWDADTKTFNSGTFATADAVQVGAERGVPTYFGQLLGVNSLTPDAKAVAIFSNFLLEDCVRPFGFDEEVMDGLDVGNIIYLYGFDAPGNWGKIDVNGINMSSGQNFEDAMRGSLCGEIVEVGDQFESGPGFGGTIKQVFNELYNEGITDFPFLLIDEFPQGSAAQVTVEGFVKTRLLSSSGNGNNWEAQFEILEFLDELVNTSGGGPGDRSLMQ